MSAHIEEGPALWRQLQAVLTEPMRRCAAGDACSGVLELLIPEFHGIDALVIRDAYHRYTVDEHTFVLIDTLHGWRSRRRAVWGVGGTVRNAAAGAAASGLLYLAALLHDTGRDGIRETTRWRARAWRGAFWGGWNWMVMRVSWCWG